MRQMATISLAVLLPGLLAGCVERTIKVTTQPQGATVILNDEEVGRTPADVRFLWHGTYDVIVRKEGYQTLHTSKKIDLPVYQWPVIDIFTELLIPYTWHEQHAWNFDLEPQQLPQREELIERATEFRHEAQEGGTATQPLKTATPPATETQPAEQP